MTPIDPRTILACRKCGSLIGYGRAVLESGGTHLCHWCPACSPQLPWPSGGVVVSECRVATEIRRLAQMTPEELIEASSLGTPEAKEARARAPQDAVDAALARADEIAQETLHVLPDHLLWRHFDDDDWNGSTAASYIHMTKAKFVRLVAPADASPELVERIKLAFWRQGAEVTVGELEPQAPDKRETCRLDWKPVNVNDLPPVRRLVQVFVYDPNHWRGAEWKQQDVGFHTGSSWVVNEELYELDGSPFGRPDGARLTHWSELAPNPDGSDGNPALEGR